MPVILLYTVQFDFKANYSTEKVNCDLPDINLQLVRGGVVKVVFTDLKKVIVLANNAALVS